MILIFELISIIFELFLRVSNNLTDKILRNKLIYFYSPIFYQLQCYISKNYLWF
jgi:hypothetical protein